MKTVLICLVVAIPLIMLVGVWALSMCWAAAKPTPPVTGPVGLDEDEHDA